MPAMASAPPSRLANKFRRKRSLISLTPLIDVVFILLIFFMLASNFLQFRSFELSAAGPGTARSDRPAGLVVDITLEGLTLDGRSVTLDALPGRAMEALAGTPGRSVLVKPAAGVPLQTAIDVLDALRGAGVTSATLTRDRGQ